MNLVKRLLDPSTCRSWFDADQQRSEAANFIKQLQAQMISDRKQYLDLRDELILLKTSLGEANE